jgi:TonB family protein
VAFAFDTTSQTPSPSEIRSIALQEHVKVSIAANPTDATGFNAAFHKVFGLTPQDALSDKTPAERELILNTVGSTAPPDANLTSASALPGQLRVLKPGGAVTPPRMAYAVEPQFTEDAKQKKIQGICVLSLIVDANGRPTHIRIRRSLEPGLDVNAIFAVSQYRFTPATFQGKPVPVLIDIEVNFRIY